MNLVDLGSAGLRVADLPALAVRIADQDVFEAPWVEVRRNHILNPGFENGLASNGGNIGSSANTLSAVVADAAHSGGFGLRRSNSLGGNVGWGQFTGVVGVGTYTYSFWARPNVTIPSFTAYREGTAGATIVNRSHNSTPLEGGVWTRVWMTLNVTTAGTIKAGYFGAVPSASDYIDTDDYMMEEGSTVGDFFAGDTLPPDLDPTLARVSWAGSPHASASVLEVIGSV